MRRISKQEAHNKYGVIVSGVNSLYNYYLTDDGYITDDCGDIRYIPPTDPRNILQRNFEGGATNAEH